MSPKAHSHTDSPDGITRAERRRLTELALLIPDQSTLNTILLDVAHPLQRGAVFDLIAKHTRFAAEYPSWVARYRAKPIDIIKQTELRAKAEHRAKKQWTV